MKSQFAILLVLACLSNAQKFAPYYDTFLRDRSDLEEIARLTGQHSYHLAFALGGIEGCKPKWGAEFDIDDPVVMNPIRAVQAMGGEMIVATGNLNKIIVCIPLKYTVECALRNIIIF